MGIGLSTANDSWAAILAQFPAGTANRHKKLRRQAAAHAERFAEILAKLDEQLNAAPQGLADSKAAQYSTFVDALPEPTLNTTPNDPGNGST
ncbi:MAG: hypothetical protein ACOZQL_10610 [Myxococcota bacterium]